MCMCLGEYTYKHICVAAREEPWYSPSIVTDMVSHWDQGIPLG